MRQTPMLLAWFASWAVVSALCAGYVVPAQGLEAALLVGFVLTALLFLPAVAALALVVAGWRAVGELRFAFMLRRLFASSRPTR